ncbi:MAG: hypothetical protein A2138_05120 [Deltaproteobacteria bacterium RBG_16_71_12]|nr:MAG: hypothetical protein A2138_05120 [Deltaproteobacteria bacterium RBG_16_71_12]
MAATQAIADLVADAQGGARQLLAPAMWAGGMVSASDGAGGLAVRSDTSLGGATATIAVGGPLWARGAGDFAFSNSAGGDISAREDRDVAVVAQDNLTITGTLDREIIRRVVREHQAQVRYCYERALQRRRGLSGKLTAHFTIGAAGTVVAARADGGALGTDVASCVDAKVRGWRFPAPRGGGVVVVSYPFVLLPG